VYAPQLQPHAVSAQPSSSVGQPIKHSIAS